MKTLADGTHVSVPAYELYNHHFGNSVLGKAAKMVKTGLPVDHDAAHAEDPMSVDALFPGYRLVNAETPATEPSPVRSAAGSTAAGGLIIGNGTYRQFGINVGGSDSPWLAVKLGAESRKTFHYFTDGYGVQVESPYSVSIHPMIIDTRNREGNGSATRPTGHGIVPPSSNVPSSAMYRLAVSLPPNAREPKLITCCDLPNFVQWYPRMPVHR